MDAKEILKSLKILLIDDDEWVRINVERVLKNRTSLFLALENAELALERLNQESFDIIICEYMLPGINGLTFFKLLENAHCNSLKVLITAHASVKIAAEALRQGIHDFLQKPLSSHAIISCLNWLVQKHEKKLASFVWKGKN